jgi:hypothetical protein
MPPRTARRPGALAAALAVLLAVPLAAGCAPAAAPEGGTAAATAGAGATPGTPTGATRAPTATPDATAAARMLLLRADESLASLEERQQAVAMRVAGLVGSPAGGSRDAELQAVVKDLEQMAAQLQFVTEGLAVGEAAERAPRVARLVGVLVGAAGAAEQLAGSEAGAAVAADLQGHVANFLSVRTRLESGETVGGTGGPTEPAGGANGTATATPGG